MASHQNAKQVKKRKRESKAEGAESKGKKQKTSNKRAKKDDITIHKNTQAWMQHALTMMRIPAGDEYWSAFFTNWAEKNTLDQFLSLVRSLQDCNCPPDALQKQYPSWMDLNKYLNKNLDKLELAQEQSQQPNASKGLEGSEIAKKIFPKKIDDQSAIRKDSCPFCHASGDDIFEQQGQFNSGDEGMTVFYTCRPCQKNRNETVRWRKR
jgi:DNA-directed RNA polymerase subunit M/transcription elongation factor TFIIS